MTNSTLPRRAKFLEQVGAGGWQAREAMAALGVDMGQVINEAEWAAQKALEQGASHAAADDAYCVTASRLMLNGAPPPQGRNRSTGSSTVVNLIGPIGAGGISPRQFLDSLPASGPVTLVVRSDGGDAVDGLVLGATVANRRAQGQHFTAIIENRCCSAATAPALSCDEVVMRPGARLMIHDAWVTGAKGTAADMAKHSQVLAGLSDNMASVYANRSGQSVSWWRQQMQQDRWISADEAVRLGLADRVE